MAANDKCCSSERKYIPGGFGDLGKKARDFIEKGFPLGALKFNHKMKTPYKVDVEGDLSHSLETSRLDAAATVKYKLPQYGLTLSEKITNSSSLVTTLEVEDKLLKGLKNTFEVKLEPSTGKQSGVIKTALKFCCVNLSADVDFPSSHPIVSSSVVFGCPKTDKEYLAGLSIAFDTKTNALKKWEGALAYQVANFHLHCSARNLNEFTASYYQRCSSKLESGVLVAYDHAAHATNFSVASKYDFDENSFVKGKIDSNSLLSVAYGFTLKPGVKLTLGGSMDGKNWNSGNHRVGLQLELESES